MLTPGDLVNPKVKSGYDHVGYNNPERITGHSGKGRPFSAHWGARSGPGTHFRGVPRDTAVEAAQDYCDLVNTGQIQRTLRRSQQPPKLKRQLQRANHPVRKSRTTAQQRPKGPARRKPSPLVLDQKGAVYLIGIAHDADYVKVGWSSSAGFPRLNELQTGNPHLLVGVAEFDGTLKDEYELHCRYEADNVLNEWFRVTPELLAEFDLTSNEFNLIVEADQC